MAEKEVPYKLVNKYNYAFLKNEQDKNHCMVIGYVANNKSLTH